MDNWKNLDDKDPEIFPILENAIENGKDWVVNSGIQNQKKDSNYFGAIHAWYDSTKNSYGFFYPESTGYAISFFLYLNEKKKNSEFVERAALAADWIQKYALVPTQKEIRHKFDFYPEKSSSRFSYSFDNSIISSGFVHLYKATWDRQYLNFSRDIADRMIQNMQSDEGYFYSHFDIETEKKMTDGDRWSLQHCSHLTKIAIFLLRLYEVKKIEKYRESAIKVCRWAMSQQMEDGRFITNYIDKSTLLHPHCYALEGMLFAGFFLDDDAMIKSGIKGIQWILSSQLSNGGIPAEFHNNSFSTLERGDSLAQTIRLTVLALNRGWISGQNYSPLLKMVNRLREFQNLDGPYSQKGGFQFLIEGDGTPGNHMNSWVTMFAVQALIMFSEFCSQSLSNELEYLL